MAIMAELSGAMTRYALRSMASHKLRTVLTAIAIVLGTAMMSGTFVITDQIRNAFSDIFGTSFAGTDVYLSRRPAFGNGNGAGPGRPPAGVADRSACARSRASPRPRARSRRRARSS